MAEALNDDEQEYLKYSDVEKEIDTFLEQLDFEEYGVYESLYYFEEEVFEKIISSLHRCKLPNVYISYKDVLREKLFLTLGCNAQDLVFIAEGIVYAKGYLSVPVVGTGAERRACGIAPEILEECKQRYFKNDLHKEKIFKLLPHVVEQTLNFRKISPIRFQKLFIPMFVNMIEIIVIGYTELDDVQSIRALSLHLLREVFDDLMLYVAEDLLFHFSNTDRKAIEFLSFFSVHDSIDSLGKRHKANPILDESNNAWNIATIRSTMIQHKNAKQAIYEKKNSLITIKNKLDAFILDQKQLTQQSVIEKERLVEVEEAIASIHKTLQKLEETDTVEVKFIEDGEEKIFQRKSLMVRIFKKEDTLLTQKNKLLKTLEEIDIRIANKQKEIDIWEKKYAENQNFLSTAEAKEHPMDKQYERILRALAKTLANR
ncbi:hypothetical protein [Sulfurospirillum oryzae]|uniref:hypothetical protein n=1 Tax=Sulfurospirillum oryzae TaxID=2976535 RepID=UPI0021E94C4D|nr:hypothetical protein [Sulfurospirillum oryzae]